VLNRGTTTSHALPDGVRVIQADVRDPASVRAALGTESFDVVADFIAFAPEHVQTDIDLLAGRTGQCVYIRSASAYEKPVGRLPIVESTLLRNPYWQYSRDKIACEDLGGWTDIDRMRRGLPVLVQGDGTRSRPTSG
jgi:hypothetical protein